MLIVLCIPFALVALLKLFRLVRDHRLRCAARGTLTPVFGAQELRDLEAHLQRIAAVELRRLDASVVRYVAGVVGHVEVVSESRHGVILGLSDGRRLTLGSLSRSTLLMLKCCAADDKLRPARVDRGPRSYRLLLRGGAGVEIELSTRSLVLAP
jgi:hypothetical protein